MSLKLDERQRAMLGEMGVRLFHSHSQPGGIDDTPPVRPRRAGGKPAIAAGVEAREPALVARAARPVVTPLVSTASGIELMEWDALAQTVVECRACSLCDGRRNTVFGTGDRQADWLIVGEAPGENEDLQGEPFLGQAGLLLDNMLKALGLNRQQQVYIANVLKCRPPDNRDPSPSEKALCTAWLDRQIELVAPRVIVPLGRHAANHVLGRDSSMGALRGQVHERAGRKVVPTFHPAYLLRSPSEKKECWKDIQLAMRELNLPAK